VSGAPTSPEGRAYALRMSAFYGAAFLIVGGYAPYLPVWLDWRGLSAPEISVVLAMPMLVRVVFTPLMSFLADRLGDHRRVLVVLTAGTLASCLALFASQTFWPILIVSTIYALFWTTVLPLSEVVALKGVRLFALDYGRMRLWGSLTFIVGTFGGGLALQQLGPPAVLWTLVGAASLTVLAALALPRAQRADAGAPVSRPLRLADAAALARSPLFLLFVIAGSLAQSSHAMLYAFGTLHLQKLGHSAAVIGGLWAIGVVAEIALFLRAGPFLQRLGPVPMLLAGAIAALVRWPIMALDPPLAVLVPLQVLHGLTFGAAHLGVIHFMGRAVPESHAGTAQGLYATLSSGIVMGLVMLMTGPLYARYEGSGFFVMGGLAGLSVLGCLALHRLWGGGLIVEPTGAAAPERPAPSSP
jgi:PPP family 3-phenylpropionic acid transporter